jgi:hypothetical protein
METAVVIDTLEVAGVVEVFVAVFFVDPYHHFEGLSLAIHYCRNHLFCTEPSHEKQLIFGQLHWTHHLVCIDFAYILIQADVLAAGLQQGVSSTAPLRPGKGN